MATFLRDREFHFRGHRDCNEGEPVVQRGSWSALFRKSPDWRILRSLSILVNPRIIADWPLGWIVRVKIIFVAIRAFDVEHAGTWGHTPILAPERPA